jgi:hypothetical protein
MSPLPFLPHTRSRAAASRDCAVSVCRPSMSNTLLRLRTAFALRMAIPTWRRTRQEKTPRASSSLLNNCRFHWERGSVPKFGDTIQCKKSAISNPDGVESGDGVGGSGGMAGWVHGACPEHHHGRWFASLQNNASVSISPCPPCTPPPLPVHPHPVHAPCSSRVSTGTGWFTSLQARFREHFSLLAPSTPPFSPLTSTPPCCHTCFSQPASLQSSTPRVSLPPPHAAHT